MTSYCLHHPQEPSHWHCPLCHGEFCNACVTARPRHGNTIAASQTLHLCPKCNREMEWVGGFNAITPFWKRLPQFFLYPFTLHVLGFLLILACLNSVFLSRPITAAALRLGAYALLLRYAYLSLFATSKGTLTPPPLGGVELGSALVIALKQTVVFVMVGVPCGIVAALVGESAGVVVFFLLAVFAPAMIILLVTSNRVLHAINPNAYIRFISRVGRGYFAMVGLLTILWGAPALLMQYIAPHVSPRLFLFGTSVLSGYYTLVSYHLMGYVTLQYHQEIGYQLDVDDFAMEHTAAKHGSDEEADPEVSPHLVKVTFLLKEGQMQEAMAYLTDVKKKEGSFDCLEVSNRYFGLLKMLATPAEICNFAEEYLAELISEKKKQEALDVFAVCMEKNPTFRPGANTLYHIGLWTSDRISPEKGILILQRAAKAYPEDSLTPSIWFRLARILNDRLHQREKATTLLQGLLKKYPDHEIATQVQNYLSAL